MSIEEVDRAIDLSFPQLEGWCTVDKAKRIARLVAESGPDPNCVELGVFGGRGVIAMGLACKLALGGKGLVEGIDPYTAAASLEGTNEQANHDWWSKVDYSKILQNARDGITRAGLDAIVRLKIARSQDVVGDYADGTLDLLHQDSNHSEEVSCYELVVWTPKMKPKGWWVFDDTNWPTTKLAQKRLVADHHFTLVEDHETWVVFRAP
jgi:hypothetical protein